MVVAPDGDQHPWAAVFEVYGIRWPASGDRPPVGVGALSFTIDGGPVLLGMVGIADLIAKEP